MRGKRGGIFVTAVPGVRFPHGVSLLMVCCDSGSLHPSARHMASADVGMKGKRSVVIRITSYNVCYTKLLRTVSCWRRADKADNIRPVNQKFYGTRRWNKKPNHSPPSVSAIRPDEANSG